MSFGQNLQYLRKTCRRISQEELAEQLNVSRQTISKWELDAAYPEVSKLIDLCSLFSCSMDQLVREDMTRFDEAYSDIRTEYVDAFDYIKYAVVSPEPEEDAIGHTRKWASDLHISSPQIIGWDFPVVSQEQISLHSMHGYTAALVLPDSLTPAINPAGIVHQERQKYLVLTIRDPYGAPFRLIPGAYDALTNYMHANGLCAIHNPSALDRFNREYTLGGAVYMDVYVAIK